MTETRSSKRTKTSKEEVEIEDNKDNADDTMNDHDAMDAATNAHNPIVSRVLALLDTPQFPLMEFFCEKPIDLLKLLFVCKAFRKAAIQKLIEMQQGPDVQWKQRKFNDFLEFPILKDPPPPPLTDATHQGEGRRQVYEDMAPSETRDKLGGPLRLEAIQNGAEYFKKRFVILDYVQTGCSQACVLAVFDEDGSLFQVYKLESRMDLTAWPYPKSNRQGIHPLCSKLVLRRWCPFEQDTSPRRRWDYSSILEHVEGEVNEEHSIHMVDTSFFELINACNNSDQFSPTEVIFVLWQALSADQHIIAEYMSTYFPDEFDYQLRRWPDLMAPAVDDDHPLLNLIYEKIEIWSNMDYM